MDAVIKIGGSLAYSPKVLRALGVELQRVSERFRVVVVPGGGRFADVVREVDEVFGLSALAAHRMAILAMDQYGLMLADLIPNSRTCNDLAEVGVSGAGQVEVFLPSAMFLREDPFEASWEVTSDAIAAYVASRLQAKRLVVVTDVDGVFTSDPKTCPEAKLLPKVSAADLLASDKATSVDTVLPRLLLQSFMNCYVVNGKYPQRINQILCKDPAVATQITP
ncbi:MAG: delta 1-pyrroline-5-carboxylate synthetase [Candidatus Bathyarchaeota archaeon]|nr:delta 1-pyrroline-5-carboxylate synthetase [Candidatus Bathyarchaeota archaeon]